MDAYGLPIEQNTGGISAPLLEKMEKSREARRRLYGKLCRLGIFLRLLTVLNGLALVGGAAYSFYEYGLDEASTTSTPMETRVRLVIEYLLMAGSGFFLVLHEQGATTDEAGTRSSLGMAFSSGGRLLLFVILALISAPAVHTTRSFIELVATAGPVGALLANALLQSWLISCAPEYRSCVVADLESRKVQVDNSAFPQIYQRDEGEHLHMGVLLPGFASRDTCTMAANCSSLTLVGDISHLEAPFSPVDTSNSTSGPFGPFSREVQLAHPVDVSVPVESRMGLGIIEFRFQKGFSPTIE